MALTSFRRAAGLAATLFTALVVAACSAGAGSQAGDADSGGAPQGEEQPAVGDGGVAGAESRTASRDEAADAALALEFERRIVKVGEISLEVAEVEQALGDVRALALALDGYVGASQASDTGSGAMLTLRVPADRFDDALDALRAMDGDVLSETTQEEDVTGTLVDLEARIENLRASEVTYRVLLERATKIEDILAVQSRLDEVRGQIEQLEAQAQTLAGDADLSTLTVRLVPRAVRVEQTTEGWNPGETVQQAVAALLVVGQALLTAVIWIGIVLLPLAVVGGLVTLVVVRVAQPLRRRAAEPRP